MFGNDVTTSDSYKVHAHMLLHIQYILGGFSVKLQIFQFHKYPQTEIILLQPTILMRNLDIHWIFRAKKLSIFSDGC